MLFFASLLTYFIFIFTIFLFALLSAPLNIDTHTTLRTTIWQQFMSPFVASNWNEQCKCFAYLRLHMYIYLHTVFHKNIHTRSISASHILLQITWAQYVFIGALAVISYQLCKLLDSSTFMVVKDNVASVSYDLLLREVRWLICSLIAFGIML